ncbi:RNA polymerase sigma factor [Lishizhenia sp.]|uniref:RNA polymerase sigma factor n=1 Tax=Lishizhenia sp. TaxID=2497594 RepID=UPI00299DB858|nr:RNA polymerase sigma factor [Lishizhenia sp.]MDX1445385.1 RNA polymerase sigma factor [Lishizhenia sp.]
MEKEQLKKIIDGCVAGNRYDQEQLFKMFYGKMLAVCMRYTKDKDSAQEVLQEAFIKIFDKLKDFDFKGSFEGWVRRIMVNASIDATRRLKRQPFRTDETYLFVSDETEEFEIDEQDLTSIKAELALEAIQELSPAYRTVFNLYAVENYTHKEIAELLDISEGTSKSNYSKAKQNLKKILEHKFVKLHE